MNPASDDLLLPCADTKLSVHLQFFFSYLVVNERQEYVSTNEYRSIMRPVIVTYVDKESGGVAGGRDDHASDIKRWFSPCSSAECEL